MKSDKLSDNMKLCIKELSENGGACYYKIGGVWKNANGNLVYSFSTHTLKALEKRGLVEFVPGSYPSAYRLTSPRSAN